MDSNINQEDNLTEASWRVYDIMSCIGYSSTIVKQRRQSFRKRDAILSNTGDNVTYLTAGSKGEGLTSSFESDYDRLNICRDVVCIFPDFPVESLDSVTIFHISDTRCHAGHFVLTLFRRGLTSRMKSIDPALVTAETFTYNISSDLFAKELEKTVSVDTGFGWNRGARAGPAMTSARGIYQRDDVFAFRCLSQDAILNDWKNRDRQYGWPSSAIINEITQLEAQLVPVGCTGSDNKRMEWRICFIPAELKLCESLNETQYKLYVLLKMVNKHILKPIGKDTSSYMMKNVIFWIVETRPNDLFLPESLLLTLKIGLEYLIEAFKNKCLPYYMIPKRNLLIGRDCLNYADELISKLKEIVADCPQVILGFPKFHIAHGGRPMGELVKEGHERDVLESLELKRQYIIASYTKQDLTREQIDNQCWMDEAYREARCKMYDMVWPDWKQYFETEHPPCLLQTTIDSMDGLNLFPDQYRRFAKRYFNIVWPHVQKCLKGFKVASEDEIIDFLALLRVKVEIALS